MGTVSLEVGTFETARTQITLFSPKTCSSLGGVNSSTGQRQIHPGKTEKQRAAQLLVTHNSFTTQSVLMNGTSGLSVWNQDSAFPPLQQNLGSSEALSKAQPSP